MNMIILSHVLKIEDRKYVMEQFDCHICTKKHDVLYIINRKTTQTIGHFVAFPIAGKWQVVDPTLPHQIMKMPDDAVQVPDDLASYSWHNNMHYFCILDWDKKVMPYKEIIKVIEHRTRQELKDA